MEGGFGRNRGCAGLKASTGQKKVQRQRERKARCRSSGQLVVLFAEAGDSVEGALLPIAALTLKVPDVQLIPKTFHDLLREQVIDQGRLDAPVVVHQLKQTRSVSLGNRNTLSNNKYAINGTNGFR